MEIKKSLVVVIWCLLAVLHIPSVMASVTLSTGVDSHGDPIPEGAVAVSIVTADDGVANQTYSIKYSGGRSDLVTTLKLHAVGWDSAGQLLIVDCSITGDDQISILESLSKSVLTINYVASNGVCSKFEVDGDGKAVKILAAKSKSSILRSFFFPYIDTVNYTTHDAVVSEGEVVVKYLFAGRFHITGYYTKVDITTKQGVFSCYIRERFNRPDNGDLVDVDARTARLIAAKMDEPSSNGQYTLFSAPRPILEINGEPASGEAEFCFDGAVTIDEANITP